MSTGAVFQAALRLINRQNLSEEANHDVLPVLEACRKKGPLALLEAAALDAQLDVGAALARAGALYVTFCAGNLCDDLIDGECTYLEEPVRMGPSLQYQLQFIGVAGLVAAGLPAEIIAAGCVDMARAASYSHREIRTKTWTSPVYRLLAEEMAGGSWAGLLSLLWWGTALAERAAPIGRRAALAGHVVEDIRSSDPRFTSMSEADRTEIVAHARAAARSLREEGLRCMTGVAADALRVLEPAA